MKVYTGANFILSRTKNGILIQLNDINDPECHEEFTFQEIGHILERSDNKDCAVTVSPSSKSCQNCHEKFVGKGRNFRR